MIKTEEGVPKELVVHVNHLVSDNMSGAVLTDTAQRLMRGEDVPVDLGFLKLAEAECDSDIVAECDRRVYEKFDGITGGGNVLRFFPYSRSVERYHILKADPDRVRQYAQSMGVTFADLLASMCIYNVSRFNGGLKVPYTMVINGRESGEYLNSIGMFAKAVPIRIDCSERDIGGYAEHA